MMARSIVIEWDPRRALVAVGTGGGGSKPAIQRTVAFDFAEGADVSPVTLAESLAAKLAEHKVGRGDATMVVERSVAEMRVLMVPPVPADELPGIVRFQAAREFSSFTDDWLLDYVPLPPLASGQHRVLAAAISPQVAAQIRGCCDKAGLNLQRVVLRPFAAARLLARAGLAKGSVLLLERLVDSVELTMMVDGAVQLARSCRVAADASGEALAKQVLGEVRRTVTAYRNQHHDGTLDRVLVMADPATISAMIEPLGEALDVPVDAIDPGTTFEIFGSVGGEAPKEDHRFAAVYGVFGEPAVNSPDAIDFLNPTRPPDPPSKRTRNILIGTAAAALIVAVASLYWLESSRLNGELETLRREIAEMSKDDEKYQDRMAEVTMIDQWVANRMPWPEMMDRLSRRLPLPDDAIVDNLSFAVDDKQKMGSIGIRGRVASAGMIKRIADDLRDPDRGIEVSGKSNSPTNREPYKFTFDETVTIDLERMAEARAAALVSPEQSPESASQVTEAPMGDSQEVAEVTDSVDSSSTKSSESAPTDSVDASESPVDQEPSSEEPSSEEPSSEEVPGEGLIGGGGLPGEAPPCGELASEGEER